jgi:hypothetical protein
MMNVRNTESLWGASTNPNTVHCNPNCRRSGNPFSAGVDELYSFRRHFVVVPERPIAVDTWPPTMDSRVCVVSSMQFLQTSMSSTLLPNTRVQAVMRLMVSCREIGRLG